MAVKIGAVTLVDTIELAQFSIPLLEGFDVFLDFVVTWFWVAIEAYSQ
jgi:hypothetical protein